MFRIKQQTDRRLIAAAAWLLSFFMLGIENLTAQQTATVFGRIEDATTGQAIDLATVYLKGKGQGVSTDEAGRYAILVPAGERVSIAFRRVGYKETSHDILPLAAGARYGLDVLLVPVLSNIEAVVRERRLDEGGMVKEKNVTDLKFLPSTTGNLESVLPSIALGTVSGQGGELSSQYQVRGGNYDENLVYVNDFEIYRPQLIRAGQQEGLTFANIDLMRDLSFSSGGFAAKYGDKLSSVLDIKYKRPDSLRASVAGSLLGGSAHVEGSFKKNKEAYRTFRYLLGARYKTTQLLLGSLDVRGEYVPHFTDIQTYLTYDLNKDWQVGFLGNYNRAVYQFRPSSLERAFGLINFALKLRTAFEGQEYDDFTNGLAGISLTYLPERERNPLYHKWLISAWRSQENERIDILGYYLLGEIEENLGSSELGDIVSVLGTGTQHNWVRNFLTTDVRNAEYKGGMEISRDKSTTGILRSHFLQWSLKVQDERHYDKINEWERIDSALYSLPFDTNFLFIRRVLKTRNHVSSQRLNLSFQDTWTKRVDGWYEWQLHAGVRGSFWNLNNEYFITPRAQILYKPLNTRRDIAYRLAAGMFYQPAFYRELRRLDGTINRNLQSQKSVHFVGGFTYDFLWGRNRPVKMRLITELYYKKMWDLVTFDIDNVRIRYAGENNAEGYAAGFDVRLNGEFVPGAESWINLSLLRTRERLNGIQHKVRKVGQTEGEDVRDVPRPTDRLFNISMFFQDYLRRNRNARMHLNLTMGTGLPFGLQDNNIVYRNTYRFTPYHRVDVGFGYLLWNQAWQSRRPRHFLRFTRNTWAALEVFNLLKVANEASNIWVKTIYNTQYAIPNYLTGRRLNFRIRMDF